MGKHTAISPQGWPLPPTGANETRSGWNLLNPAPETLAHPAYAAVLPAAVDTPNHSQASQVRDLLVGLTGLSAAIRLLKDPSPNPP